MGGREDSNGAMLDIAISAAIGRVEPVFASNTQPPAPIQPGSIIIKLRLWLPAPMRNLIQPFSYYVPCRLGFHFRT